MLLDLKTKSHIFIKLYKNVKNTKEIKRKLSSQEIECCIVNCSLILDPFQIVVAANKALVSVKQTTKSINTEILFNLSITKNISKSLMTFGLQENDDCFLIVFFNETHGTKLQTVIIGEEVHLSELKGLRDVNAIKKYYGISEAETKVIPLIDSVVSRIATKDFFQ